MKDAIWIAPVIGMFAALLVARLLYWVDLHLQWRSEFDTEAVRAVVITLAGAVFTLIVFVCSALLIAVQLASVQLTPRIIAMVYRDPETKLSLTLFMFNFTLLLAASVRIGATAPLLVARVAVYTTVISLAAFLYVIDHIGKRLRAGIAMRYVGQEGRRVIRDVYPKRLGDEVETALNPSDLAASSCLRTIPSPRDGVVMAFDLKGLIILGQQHRCIIEMVPQVGDFVTRGDTLFRIFEGGTPLTDRELCDSAAIGLERTPRQDATFSFRILVDIASKALSPAINDPTTAVLAIDQIHSLLRSVGMRHLDQGQVRDHTGRLSLVYRTPDWEDFVRLAVTEIRQYGCTSIQVSRRLRAMLEDLIEALPSTRAPLLQRELALLGKSSNRSFPEAEDRALAEEADSQGVGGSKPT
jgi:uncharacterized membrane protein